MPLPVSREEVAAALAARAPLQPYLRSRPGPKIFPVRRETGAELGRALEAYEARLKRDLLTKLGRGNEALDDAWTEYREHPSKYSYADLMKHVPKAERAAWHKKAIEAAKGSDLHSLIELLVKTRELDRLAELVRHSTDDALEALRSTSAILAANRSYSCKRINRAG